MVQELWGRLAQVLLSGAVAYALLVVLLRLSGKRTLSKLNAFDLVVTVAMGSMLASVIVSSQVRLAEGVAGFLLLVLGQYLVAKLSVWSRGFADLVRSTPRVLYWRGQMLEEALRDERVCRQEVLAAVRQSGLARLQDVGAVVLETDGSISVLPAAAGEMDALDGVRR